MAFGLGGGLIGADVNAQDKNGNIPLHAAAKGTRIDIVKYLVDKGADVARRNKHRQTPYDVATNHIIRQYLLPLQFRVSYPEEVDESGRERE